MKRHFDPQNDFSSVVSGTYDWYQARDRFGLSILSSFTQWCIECLF
jgi:hypothetical protein